MTPPHATPFPEALSRFMDRFDDGAGLGLARLVRPFVQRWLARWSDWPVSKIDARSVLLYLKEQLIKDVSREDVERQARELRGFFAWCSREGLVRENPLGDILEELEAPERLPPLCWGRTEQERLLETCRRRSRIDSFRSRSLLSLLYLERAGQGCNVPWLHPLLVIGLRTGLRLGNLLYLEWRHVSFGERRISIPGGETCTGQRIEVEIDELCLELLEMIWEHALDRGADSPRVFDALDLPCDDEGVPEVQVVQVHLRAACLRAHVREGEFECARFGFAYRLIREGIAWEDLLDRSDWDFRERNVLRQLWHEWRPRAAG